MRQLSAILLWTAVCLMLPPGVALGTPRIEAAAFGAMYPVNYPHHRYRHFDRRHHRPRAGRLHQYAPRYNAPFLPRGHFRPIQNHRRYYGMHGFRSPGWRYPNTLRLQNYRY